MPVTNHFLTRSNLDSDVEVDEDTGKLRFVSILTGEGAPSTPPAMPTKGWSYFDITDPDHPVEYVWLVEAEDWAQVAGGTGGGGSLLIVDVPGNSDPVTVPGPDVAMNVVLRLLPSTVGGENQKIIVPRPTGSGQRISGVVGVNMDGAQTDWYPGESIWYVAPVVEPATRASLDLAPLLGLSYPISPNVTVNVVFDGVSGGAPTSVAVTLNDTYADATAVALDLIDQATAAQAAHGFSFGPIPDTDSGIGFYSGLAGAASVTLNSIVGSGVLAAALAAAVATPGLDAVEGDTDIEYGILHLQEGTLGTPLGGGTHTSPSNAIPHQKGWAIVDVAPGVWSVEQWPFRGELMTMTWLEQFFGPLGKNEEQKTLQQLIYHLRSALVPESSQRTLVRASRLQAISGLDKDRFLLFSTAIDGDDISYLLANADAPQPDVSEANPDFGCRGYTLEFWRSDQDDPAQSVMIGDGDAFSFALAPGEAATIRSQLIGYIDTGLPAGTAPGQLDDPVNQVFGWVRLREQAATDLDGIIRANPSGTSVVAGPAAGDPGSASLTPGSSDSAGYVSITVGPTPTSGVLATVTFSTPLPGIAIPILGPGDPESHAVLAASVRALPNGAPSSTGFVIRTDTSLAEGEYEFAYHVVGLPA